jgi:GAF domain-containing protein
MFTLRKKDNAETNLMVMVQAVKGLLEDESSPIAALANISAAINVYLENINWVGFYLLAGKELVLGPFQGLPACSRIGEGKGVCGRAVQEARPVIVGNVHKFPGHIACDSASLSEIVIPFFKNAAVYGVLDVDSPNPDRFTALEEDHLSQICRLLGAFLEGLDPERMTLL